jgi:phosphoglycerate dehydrogenase-like enzyme/catechol 2,3-dioxygenase-like lactoylglutathione lyase family enzyme
MDLRGIGYLGLGVPDPDAWCAYATSIVGLEQVADAPDGSIRLKADERQWRVALQRSDRPGLAYVGFELGSRADFDAARSHLEAVGAAVTEGKPDELEARGVRDLVHIVDPSGVRIELYWGPTLDGAFTSPVGVPGFVATTGFGHYVPLVPDLEASMDFCRTSRHAAERLHPPGSRHVGAVPALHGVITRRACRWVSAVATSHSRWPTSTRSARPRARCGPVTITATLGRHKNDRMLSFYMRARPGSRSRSAVTGASSTTRRGWSTTSRQRWGTMASPQERWPSRSQPVSTAPVRVLSHVGPLPEVAEALKGVEITPIPGDRPLADDVHGDVLLTLMRGTPNLPDVLERGVRWVHTIGTGVDEFPLDLLGDRIVTCSRGMNAVPIAEWAMAQMLCVEKQLPAMWVTEPPAQWGLADLGGLVGKTLAIVGFGSIGTALARRALAFDMTVRAMRRTARPSPLAGVELVTTVPELVRDADHIVLAAPATRATRAMVDESFLANVKRGAHLVNVARAALVDEAALRAALDDGQLGLASIDVASTEPLEAGHWFYSHPRVRFSPHVSWRAGHVGSDATCVQRNPQRRRSGEPLAGWSMSWRGTMGVAHDLPSSRP